MRYLLILSLIINLCLGAALGLTLRHKDASTPSSAAASAAATSSAKPVAKAPAAAEPGAAPADSQQFNWQTVESADYKKYIANLRAIGCPEETIRDIIIADVNKLFESRRKEANGGGKKFEFWKSGNPFSAMMDSDKLEKQQKLGEEKRALLKELLGFAPEEKFDMFAGMNPFESMLDFLPGDKQNEVMRMFQDVQVQVMKKFKDGQPDPQDMKEVQKLQKDMETKLAAMLSPQEFEEYQLRMTQTAMSMRMGLSAFDPTEQEFRDIFKVRKAYDDEYSPMGFDASGADKVERDKRAAAKKETDAQIKAILGDARYAEYERAQDYSYQAMAKVAERNELSKDAAVKVYDLKKLAESEAKKLRSDKTMAPADRTAALQGIRTETENSIRTVFGDKAYESYQKQNGSQWLNGISPAPKKLAEEP